MILLCVIPPPALHFLHMRPKSLPSVALSTSWWTCARVSNRKSAACGTRSLNFALVWPPQCLPAHCLLPHRLAQSALVSVTFRGLTLQSHAADAWDVLFRSLVHVLSGTVRCIAPVLGRTLHRGRLPVCSVRTCSESASPSCVVGTCQAHCTHPQCGRVEGGTVVRQSRSVVCQSAAPGGAPFIVPVPDALFTRPQTGRGRHPREHRTRDPKLCSFFRLPQHAPFVAPGLVRL